MMKRIALILDGHTGSVLPLAKKILNLGYAIDLFIIIGKSIKENEAVKIDNLKVQYGVHKINNSQATDLYNYMNSEQFNLFYLAAPRPYKSIPVLRFFYKIIRHYFFKRISHKLNPNNYNAINLIGRQDSEMFIWFHNYLNCYPILTSLHEVCDHLNPKFDKPSNLLNYLLKNRKQIVVHSQKSLSDILNFKNSDKKYINHINFGLFESYLTIHPKNISTLPQKYILFYGSINSYKGLNILYEAVSNNRESFNEFKIVIAGKGIDPIIDKIKIDDMFHLINNFLSNEELVELIKKAYFIVCPYISASQSGIPQTTFLFNKPIIASNIGSFPEIIIDEENGFLFESGNVNDLTKAMIKLINDKKVYTKFVSNINNFNSLYPDFSWDNIVMKYVKLF